MAILKNQLQNFRVLAGKKEIGKCKAEPFEKCCGMDPSGSWDSVESPGDLVIRVGH